MLIHVLIVLLLLAIYFVIFEPYVETFAPSWPTSPARGNFGILATNDDLGPELALTD